MSWYVRPQLGIIRRARRGLARMIAGGRQRPILAAGPYRGGDITRLNKSWQPISYSGDKAIAEAMPLLARRLRDLGRNDPAIISLRNALLDNVVATGITATANVDIDGEMDDEFNDEADRLFEDWCEQDADYYGRLSFEDIQRQFFAELVENGECLLLRASRDDPNRQLPLCYQVLEADQIDSNQDQTAGNGRNEIRRGIEMDRTGRPIAYWLYDVHPDDPHAGLLSAYSKRVPADRVIHIMSPGRPSQTRGIGLYASITQSARDLDNYLGSELTSAIIGSLLTIVQKTAVPGSGMGFVGDGTDTETTDDYGNKKVKLGKGIVCQIPREDDISVVSTNRPNSSADTFVRLILMLIGMGGGVSYYRVTRNYSGTTYVSARAAHLDDRAAFRPMQRYIGRQLCLTVRRDWTAQAAAFDLFRSLSPSQFLQQQRRWQRCSLLYPGWEHIDPEKEGAAEINGLKAGTMTHEEIQGKRGRNWRRVMQQRRREEVFAESIGLTLNYDLPNTPGGGNQQQQQREEQNADQD